LFENRKLEAAMGEQYKATEEKEEAEQKNGRRLNKMKGAMEKMQKV
jgi:hypothetical protein